MKIDTETVREALGNLSNAQAQAKRIRELERITSATGREAKLKAHAEKLAEALRGAVAALSQTVAFRGESHNAIQILQGDCSAARKILTNALANWEEAKQ